MLGEWEDGSVRRVGFYYLECTAVWRDVLQVDGLPFLWRWLFAQCLGYLQARVPTYLSTPHRFDPSTQHPSHLFPSVVVSNSSKAIRTRSGSSSSVFPSTSIKKM